MYTMEELVEKLVPGGVIFTGRYKRANRKGSNPKLEVAGIADVPTQYGINVWVVGTRLDAGNEGQVVGLRLDCFNPDTIEVTPAKNFVPIKAEEYLVTVNNPAFAPLERIEDPVDLAWGVGLGGMVLATLMRAPAKTERKARAKKVAELLTSEVEA